MTPCAQVKATEPIDGATTATYTPAPGDVDMCLQATAIYQDNILTDTDGDTTSTIMERAVQLDDAANAAPKFPDQDPDTVGDQSDHVMREVGEHAVSGTTLGVELQAEDANDLLIHTIDGDDAASFSVDRKSGQLSTKAELNYEMQDTHMVTITATDPSGASDTISVTINVMDEDDKAEITGDKEVTGFDENTTGYRGELQRHRPGRGRDRMVPRW